jgi:anthranilate phosphoribosyltransferase
MIEFIKEAGRGPKGSRHLTVPEAEEAARQMLSGMASDAQCGALLLSLRVKGETGDEIAGFTRALRRNALPWSLPAGLSAKLCDCAGPHDGRKSFAATIPVAVICALAGLPTLLHASPSLPPKQGLSLEEILGALGLDLASCGGERAAADLGSQGVAYVNMEAMIPGLAHQRRVRTEIGVRSLWNHAEKLVDLGSAGTLVVGIHHASALEKLARVADVLETRLALFQGNDGSEDLPIHRRSVIQKVGRGPSERVEVDPTALGLDGPAGGPLDLPHQAWSIQAVLSGERGELLEPLRRQVLLNVAARLWVAGTVERLEDGVEAGWELLASGHALTRLLAWLRPKPAALGRQDLRGVQHAG